MEAQWFALDQAIGITTGADHPDLALAISAVDLGLAIGLHAQGGVLINADADDVRVAAVLRGACHEHDEAAKAVTLVEMGVGDHALQVGHLQEATVHGDCAAHRIGQRTGRADAAAIHGAIGIAAEDGQASAGTGNRLAGAYMGVERAVECGALPEADVARLVAAGNEDGIGRSDHAQHGWIIGTAAAVEDQRLYRGGAADLAVQAVLQFIATGGTQDQYTAIAGLLQPPLEGIRHPLATAHQHHRGCTRPGTWGLKVADLVIGKARALQILRGRGRRPGQHEQRQPGNRGTQGPVNASHLDLPEQNRLASVFTLCQIGTQ